MPKEKDDVPKLYAPRLEAELSQLNRDLFKVGAVEIGTERMLKDGSTSTIYFNLRTAENPKPGSLDPGLVDRIASLMVEEAIAEKLHFDAVAGIPEAGNAFAKAFAKIYGDRVGRIISVITLGKTGEGENRRISHVIDDAGVCCVDAAALFCAALAAPGAPLRLRPSAHHRLGRGRATLHRPRATRRDLD